MERNLVELWIQVKECQEFPPGCGTVDQIFTTAGVLEGSWELVAHKRVIHCYRPSGPLMTKVSASLHVFRATLCL